MQEFYFSAKLISIGIAFLLLAGFYIFKSLNFSSSFGIFKDNFYSSLSTKGFKDEIIIKDNSISPELWKTVFLFGISVVVDFWFMGIKDIVLSDSILFYGLATLASILIVLLVVLVRRSTVSPKMTFLLVGFELCVFLAVYMNGPIFILDEISILLNDAEYLIGR